MEFDKDLTARQEARELARRAETAQRKLAELSQGQLDAIVEAVAKAFAAQASALAEMAVQETGFGNAEDKRAKNLFASQRVAEAVRDMRTVGLLREVPEKKLWEIGVPVGVIAAIIPSGIVGVLFDDWMEAHFHNATVVSIALIVYGVAFILVERRNARRVGGKTVEDVYAIDYKTALLIGCFQCLSLIPGTSRSGSTILGAILIGVGRSAGAEFSFFMAIPTMLGASAIKGLKFLLSGVTATGTEIGVLIVGCVVSFVVSLLVIRGLMEYVRRHSFSAFGVYRIILGVVVLVYFALAG